MSDAIPANICAVAPPLNRRLPGASMESRVDIQVPKCIRRKFGLASHSFQIPPAAPGTRELTTGHSLALAATTTGAIRRRSPPARSSGALPPPAGAACLSAIASATAESPVGGKSRRGRTRRRGRNASPYLAIPVEPLTLEPHPRAPGVPTAEERRPSCLPKAGREGGHRGMTAVLRRPACQISGAPFVVARRGHASHPIVPISFP